MFCEMELLYFYEFRKVSFPWENTLSMESLNMIDVELVYTQRENAINNAMKIFLLHLCVTFFNGVQNSIEFQRHSKVHFTKLVVNLE